MMRQYKRIGMLLMVVLLVVSCDYLNQVPDDRMTLDKAFTQKRWVLDYLSNIYSRIPREAQRFVAPNAGPWTAASDEAEVVWPYYFQNSMNVGATDPTTGFYKGMWDNYYRGIRKATYFIKHVDQCEACSPGRIVRYRAEARALRAMFYYFLMRSWGPVIVFKDGMPPADASLEALQIPRTPWEEGVNYVVNQLEMAGEHLPPTPPTPAYYGRVTQAVTMAMKVRMLMLSASPLFNGNTDYANFTNPDGTQLIPQQYDASKWKRAADAAKAFIDRFVPDAYSLYRTEGPDGEYSAYLSTRDVMLVPWNSEIIFARTNASVDQYLLTPFHSGEASANRGSGGMGVTQTMVDAYFMANGYSIHHPKSGYKKSGFSMFKAPYDFKERRTFNQWVNRGPRFYVGVTYNGSLWLNTEPEPIVTKTWFKGNSGKQIGGNDYTRTGYIVRKNKGVGSANPTIPMIRLAEIFLDYAEALNEYDPGNPDILKYLNKIRDRAGIPGYGSGSNQIPAPEGQIAMRKAIHHERRVELAFEGHRYFDTRRWKIADETAGGEFYGMDITAQSESEFYDRVVFETRVFEPKGYLFPIPQSEVSINDKLVQNPGW